MQTLGKAKVTWCSCVIKPLLSPFVTFYDRLLEWCNMCVAYSKKSWCCSACIEKKSSTLVLHPLCGCCFHVPLKPQCNDVLVLFFSRTLNTPQPNSFESAPFIIQHASRFTFKQPANSLTLTFIIHLQRFVTCTLQMLETDTFLWPVRGA